MAPMSSLRPLSLVPSVAAIASVVQLHCTSCRCYSGHLARMEVVIAQPCREALPSARLYFCSGTIGARMSAGRRAWWSHCCHAEVLQSAWSLQSAILLHGLACTGPTVEGLHECCSVLRPHGAPHFGILFMLMTFRL